MILVDVGNPKAIGGSIMKSSIAKTSFFFVIFIITTFLPMSALSADLLIVIKNANDNMGIELATPFSKVGLESIVYNFYEARVNLAPNQYERKPEFTQIFMGTYKIFSELVWKGDIKAISDRVTSEDMNKMNSFYQTNENKFQSFVKQLESGNGKFILLKTAGSELILRSQIFFSLMLLGGNRSAYETASKWTPGFPFCKLPSN